MLNKEERNVVKTLVSIEADLALVWLCASSVNSVV